MTLDSICNSCDVFLLYCCIWRGIIFPDIASDYIVEYCIWLEQHVFELNHLSILTLYMYCVSVLINKILKTENWSDGSPVLMVSGCPLKHWWVVGLVLSLPAITNEDSQMRNLLQRESGVYCMERNISPFWSLTNIQLNDVRSKLKFQPFRLNSSAVEKHVWKLPS